MFYFHSSVSSKEDLEIYGMNSYTYICSAVYFDKYQKLDNKYTSDFFRNHHLMDDILFNFFEEERNLFSSEFLVNEVKDYFKKFSIYFKENDMFSKFCQELFLKYEIEIN